MNTENATARNLGAVILAAGRSVRMGRPKLLLPWGDTSVLGHQIRTWHQLGAGQVTVVCGASDPTLRAELDCLNFPTDLRILNPEPERGMFGSIRCAVQWSSWREITERFAIVLGDQPQVRQETLRVLLEFSAQHATQVCQPRAGGRPRHPVILPRKVFVSLCSRGASSLKDFLRSQSENIALCDIEDPGLEFDLDTSADYAEARTLYLPPR